MTNDNKIKRHFRMPPMLFVLLGFLAVMLVGAFLLALPISNTDGKWMSFIHAVFWATNGVCGTGLVIKSTALSLTGFGQAILFLLVQFGGLGFMTFATFVFILIRKRITLKDRIAISEALGQEHIKGVVRLVRNIAFMTGIIELAGALLLLPFFVVKNGAYGVWQALFNSVSAFCNAGFDVMGTESNPFGSLCDYNGNAGILLIISALSILGAFGFPVINDVLKKRFRWRRYRFHTKLVLISTLIIMTFGTLFFLVSEFNSAAFDGMNGGEKLLNSLFQSVMASSTAGFSSIDQNALSSSGKVFTCILMFIGASPCSTGGGIKTTTFAVLLLMGISGLSGKSELVMFKRSINLKTGLRAVAVAFIATVCIFVGAMIITATDTAPLGNNFFESVTAFSTTGLSMGTTTVASAYTYSSSALTVLAVIMTIGRLGPLSIGMIFVKPDNSSIKYPSTNIMIG